METLTVKKFINETEKIIASLRSAKNSLILTHNNRPAVVIQSIEEFTKQQKAYLFLKLMAQGEHDVKKGNVTPQAKLFNDLKKKLRRKHAKV